MQRVCVLAVLAALAALAAAHQPGPAEWMPGAARRAARPALPPHDPDAEIIGPITDPRPAVDGNFQAPHGHRLAGVYRNDKPRLPDDYVRYLREQGLTPGQIKHGAGEGPSRLVRAPVPAPSPAPAPGQVRLPGGYTLHLVPERSPLPAEVYPAVQAAPAEMYPAVQEVPAPSIDHLRAAPAAQPSTRRNEVGVSAVGGVAYLPAFPDTADLRRHHRRVKQQLDEQWRRLDEPGALLHGRRSSHAPFVRESYSVRQLPGGGRRVSYRKHTKHSSSYSSRVQPSYSRPARRQRRKRRPSGYRQVAH